MKRCAAALVNLLIAIFFITGCATNTRATSQNDKITNNWHGRLAIHVEAPPDDVPAPRPQSFSASFELSGTPDAGELIFFTPLGSTAAAIHWSPAQATLATQSQIQTFSGLSPLIQDLLGTDVPVQALFAWLNGHALAADGWQVDLANFDRGKITAQRFTAPAAQLRLILEP